jgi:hypothetical protein
MASAHERGGAQSRRLLKQIIGRALKEGDWRIRLG